MTQRLSEAFAQRPPLKAFSRLAGRKTPFFRHGGGSRMTGQTAGHAQILDGFRAVET